MIEQLEPFFTDQIGDRTQKEAWREWLSRGFPSKKSEAYRYVSLKQLESISSVTKALYDFKYQIPPKVMIVPLSDAKRSHGPLLEKQYIEHSKVETDPFFFLNHALNRKGLFIYVPPGLCVKEPLNLTQEISPSLEGIALAHPKLEIFVGKGASLTVVTSIDSKKGMFWNNGAIHVTLEEGAHYTHYDEARHHTDSWDFLAFRAYLKKESSLKFFSFGRGALVQRRDLAIALEGEHAKVELKGISLLSDALEGHVHIRIDHRAPNTFSNQFFKSVLSKRSRFSFEGKILIEKEAQKTKAYQLNNNLILSEKAAAFSKPNLEIFADDVQASHGATVSKPHLDELFYLRSRGLNSNQAQHHLVKGFCRELIQEVSLPPLFHRFNGEIDAYLSSE